MDLFPIIDDADHARALRAVDALWNAEEGTAESAALDAFATLIDAYERKRWPIEGRLDPVDLLRYAIDELGRSQDELAALIGKLRASEVLRRERPMTLDDVRTIGAAWSIPVELLARPYRVARLKARAKRSADTRGLAPSRAGR